MIKKICFLLLLSATVLVASSCSEEVITGDGKSGEDYPWTEKGLAEDSSDYQTNLLSDLLPGTDKAETKQDVSPDSEPSAEDSKALKLIETMGSLMPVGVYSDDAEIFAKAVTDANGGLISAYTGGIAEDYSFLEDVKIKEYVIYPFEFSQEKSAQLLIEGKVVMVDDCYMVSFFVTESNNGDFPVGENVRFMGFVSDPVTGCRLSAFVAPELIDEVAFDRISTDFTDEVVIEFSTFYAPKLADGEYNPQDFDLSESMHLITHLMAKSRRYNAEKPYTIDQVNDFVSHVFAENAGVGNEIENLSGVWDVSVEMVQSDEEAQEDAESQEIIYLSGCDMNHEKYIPEYIMEKSETENGIEYAVTLFSDYSHFAVAKRMTFTFETEEGELPKLVGVTQTDSTGSAVAYTVA